MTRGGRLSRKRKTRRAGRRARDRQERQQDARLVATQVREVGRVLDGRGTPLDIQPDDWIVAVSPVAMPDGRTLYYHPPQPVAFNLIEAKRHRDPGVRKRRRIMGNLEASTTDAGHTRYSPQNSHTVLDCLSELVGAVLHAFTAIESLANHSIEQLPPEATISVERHDGPIDIPRDEMVRRMSVTEKLDQAIPLLEDGHSTKGTRAWERYVHLKRLRDDLVHVKDRGYSNDPNDPSAYGQLLLGAGDDCVEEAAALVQAARPIFLPAHVCEALGIDPVA